MDCSKDSSRVLTFTFSDNLATNGGDDVYGGSFLECFYSVPYPSSCFAATYNSNTSVSSDPLRVCVRNSYGQPQCEIDAFVFMHCEVHPGEIFTIPSDMIMVKQLVSFMLVFFLLNNLLTNTQFKLSEWSCNNNKQCTSFNFTLFTNYIATQEFECDNVYHCYADGYSNCA